MPNSNSSLSKFLEKIEKKIDSLDLRLDSVDKILVKQEANLGEHMRRTELAEKSINHIKKDLEPIKRHVAYVEGALKAVGVLSMISGLAIGFVKLLTYL